MSDLISRIELLKEIKSLSIVLNGKQIFSDDAKDTVLRIINEQPTAYSVDRVVEELEKLKNEKTMGRHKVKIKDAIEIVKQGGVREDVCEWTQSDDIAINPHTFSKYKIKQCDGLYALSTCPYCRKKIKVVE